MNYYPLVYFEIKYGAASAEEMLGAHTDTAEGNCISKTLEPLWRLCLVLSQSSRQYKIYVIYFTKYKSYILPKYVIYFTPTQFEPVKFHL